MASDSLKDNILNAVYKNFIPIVGTLAVGSFLVWSYFPFNNDPVNPNLTKSTQNSGLPISGGAGSTHSGSGDIINTYGGVTNIYHCSPCDSAKFGSIDTIVGDTFAKVNSKPLTTKGRSTNKSNNSGSKKGSSSRGSNKNSSSKPAIVVRAKNTLGGTHKDKKITQTGYIRDTSYLIVTPVVDLTQTTYVIDSAKMPKMSILPAASNTSLERFELQPDKAYESGSADSTDCNTCPK